MKNTLQSYEYYNNIQNFQRKSIMLFTLFKRFTIPFKTRLHF